MVFVSVGFTCVGIFTFHRVQKLSMTGVGGDLYKNKDSLYFAMCAGVFETKWF